MTKEEKIKEVYGDRLEIVKDFICMHSGVVSDRQYNQIDCPTPTECNFENDECYSFWTREDNGERVVDVFNWIPKTLQGIEDNNGWTKIESIEDLPLEKVNCYYYDLKVNYLSDLSEREKSRLKNLFELGVITNLFIVKPTPTPKPPIY